jgi:hypothetical protein
VRAILADKATWVDREREREANCAQRYRHHHALQSAGLRDSAMPAGCARGQVDNSGGRKRRSRFIRWRLRAMRMRRAGWSSSTASGTPERSIVRAGRSLVKGSDLAGTKHPARFQGL